MLATGRSKMYLVRLFGFALLLLCTQAHATYTVYMYESGGDVIATGEGSINIAALTYVPGNFTSSPLTASGNGLLYIGGNAGANQFDRYNGVTGPVSYGTNAGPINPTSTTGPYTGIVGIQSYLFVPPGYVSGSPLASTGVWAGTTLAALLATPGRYAWTWGSGPTADSFVLYVGSPPPARGIPTLSEWSLIAMSMVLATVAGWQMRRRQR